MKKFMVAVMALAMMAATGPVFAEGPEYYDDYVMMSSTMISTDSLVWSGGDVIETGALPESSDHAVSDGVIPEHSTHFNPFSPGERFQDLGGGGE